MHAAKPPYLAYGCYHILNPDFELIGSRIDFRGVSGARIIESERGCAEACRRIRKRAHAAVRTNGLVAKRLAYDDTKVRYFARVRSVKPAEKPVCAGIEIQGVSHIGRSLLDN